MVVGDHVTVSVSEVTMLLEAVCDPEIPCLTIADLGVLREVRQEDNAIVIVITPTYSGCPAMCTIEQDICSVLSANAIDQFTIETQLAPAWTTDWLSEQGRKKLLAAGIAPPAKLTSDKRVLTHGSAAIPCPQCESTNTQRISEFGSTACKALYRCLDCLEPFDYFKCL